MRTLLAAWRLYFRDARVYAGIVLAVFAPLYTFSAALQAYGPLPAGQAEELCRTIGLLLTPLVNAAVIVATETRARGVTPTWRLALRAASTAWGRMLSLYVVSAAIGYGVLVAGVTLGVFTVKAFSLHDSAWLLPFAVPAVYFLTRLALADALIVVDGLEPRASRATSARLVRGAEVRIALVAGLAFLPAFFLTDMTRPLALRYARYTPMLDGTMIAVLDVVCELLFVPVPIVFYLLYRERKNLPIPRKP